MSIQEIMQTRKNMMSMGIDAHDVDSIITSSISMSYKLDDMGITEYHAILKQYGRKTMSLVMAMEKYYDTPRSWFMNHIDDDDNNVGIDDNDGISIQISGLHSVMKFKDKYHVTLYMMLKHIRSIDDDMYDVIHCVGWDNLCELYINMTELFPYKEYKTSRNVLYGIIRSVIHDRENLAWVMELITWIISKRPFFNDKVDDDWVMSRIDYPIEFLKESYDFSDDISYDDYSAQVDKSLEIARQRISVMGMSSSENDNCMRCLESMKAVLTETDTQGRTRLINASNLSRWMVYAKRLNNLPDEFFTIVKNIDVRKGDDEELGVWDIYTFISRGNQQRSRNWPSLPYRNITMSQTFSATNEYVDITTRNVDSMLRWAQWMKVQHELYSYHEMLIVNDSEKLVMMQFNEAKMYKVPIEIREWILRGKIPDSITYGNTAYLTLPKYAKDIMQEPR